MKNINNLTNQITYNRLLRSTSKILKENVFELNDDFTRYNMKVKLRNLYNKAKSFAIKDYKITIKEFDSTRPHYIEVDIMIQFHNMVEYVHLNINNIDDL